MANTPTGAIFSIATTFAAPVTVSVVTNALPCVVTATAHGYANNDVVELTSGWGRLNKRVFEVSGVTANTFNLALVDTTDTSFYPTGTGIGSVRKITAFTQIAKVMNPSKSGGEPKKITYKFLDSDVEYSINDGFTATSYTFDLDDDTTTAGYTAMRALTDVQTDTVLKILLRSGSRIYLPGRVTLNDVPQLQDGQINKISAAFDGNNRHSRY